MIVEAIYGAYAALVCSVAYLYTCLLVQTLSGGRQALCTSTGRVVLGITVLSGSSALFSAARVVFFHGSLEYVPAELMVFLFAMMAGWFMLSAHWFMEGGKVNCSRACAMAAWMVTGAIGSVIAGLL